MRLAKKSVLALSFVGVLSLTGCASIVNGVHQSVSVSTDPVVSATCTLTNSKGTWFVNSTPGSVVVHRAYGDLNISCLKKGYEKGIKRVKSSTKAMVFGNAVFGGVLGAGLDVADGASYSYPVQIHVPMRVLSQNNSTVTSKKTTTKAAVAKKVSTKPSSDKRA